MTLERMLVTEPIFWQSLALVAVLGSILLIVVGVRMSKRTTPSIWQEAQWLRQIKRMAHGEDSHEYRADDLQAVWRQWLRQLGAAVIGAGAGVLVGTLVSFGMAQLALHAPFSLPDQLFWFCFMPPMWGMTLGFTCGGMVAGQRRVAARGQGAAVADPSVSHKVLEYRSPLLTVFVAIPAIVYTTLTILVAPKYSPFDAFDLQEYLAIHGHELVLPPHWILAIFPGAMWLTVLLVEVCAWARVKSAASNTSPDAALARGASMALTELNLGFIYSPMILASVLMGNPTVQLLSLAAHALGLDSILLTVFTTTLIVGYTSNAVVLLFALEGRLGGRLTGWPWSGRTARDGGAAAAGEGGVV